MLDVITCLSVSSGKQSENESKNAEIVKNFYIKVGQFLGKHMKHVGRVLSYVGYFQIKSVETF